MNDKPYKKIGNTYFPKKQEVSLDQDRLKGSYWEAWKDGEYYFFKFDVGHFMSKFRTVSITKQEFEDLRSGKISDKDLATRYS